MPAIHPDGHHPVHHRTTAGAPLCKSIRPNDGGLPSVGHPGPSVPPAHSLSSHTPPAPSLCLSLHRRPAPSILHVTEFSLNHLMGQVVPQPVRQTPQLRLCGFHGSPQIAQLACGRVPSLDLKRPQPHPPTYAAPARIREARVASSSRFWWARRGSATVLMAPAHPGHCHSSSYITGCRVRG